jgi:hypothetical protein
MRLIVFNVFKAIQWLTINVSLLRFQGAKIIIIILMLPNPHV